MVPSRGAGAFHVLNDDVRLAVDVAREVLGEQAALDVGRPPGGEVDQDGEALALVERLVGMSRRHGGDEGAEREGCAHDGHLDPPGASVVAQA
jgi:hypothetical protein